MIVQREGAVYYTAPDGVTYRVYDPRRRDGRWVAMPPRAGSLFRAFVPPSGRKRVYTFDRGEDHALAEALLARQLARSRRLPLARRQINPSSTMCGAPAGAIE